MEKKNNYNKIRNIEKLSLILLLVFTLISLVFVSLPITLGVLLGGAIVIGNFYWLSRLLEKALNGEGVSKLSLAVNFFVKSAFLLGSVILVILYTKVDPIALLAGLTTIIIAILLAGGSEIWKKGS
ncbi:MAG: ATP synthase subunit I [Deltaproteobacteria bacterium]|nr:MAG: ATP synthase subunit I [Deltaproteobacteria bacterium]